MADRSNQAEILTEMTDQILAGGVSPVGIGVNHDQQLSRSEGTIRRLQQTFPDRQPDPELKNRIRAKLTVEWSRSGPGSQKGTSAWHSTRHAQWKTAWRIALAVILVGVAILVVFPPVTLVSPGAAVNATGWIPVIVVCIILGILAIWLLLLNKRR